MILRKFLTRLLLICIPFLVAGYLLASFTPLPLHFSDVILLTASFTAISVVATLIFAGGLKKGPEGATTYLMVAQGLKLILELVLALVWFVVVKKTYLSSVLLFFILYLTISLYSTVFMLNTLKSKPL